LRDKKVSEKKKAAALGMLRSKTLGKIQESQMERKQEEKITEIVNKKKKVQTDISQMY
jgi:hypothetical protein